MPNQWHDDSSSDTLFSCQVPSDRCDLQAFWRRVPRWDPGFLNGRHGPSLPSRPWRPWPLSGERSRCVPQGCAGGCSGWDFSRWLRKTSWLFPTKHTFEWIDTEKPTMVKHPPSWDSWCVEVIATKRWLLESASISECFTLQIQICCGE